MRRAPTWFPLAVCCATPLVRAWPQAAPRVIQYSAPVSGKLHLDSVPRLDLGGAGALEFDRISAIRLRGDGTIIVANSGSKELRLFDRTARFLKAIGRPGSGPGEYAEIARIDLLPGDSIAVFDPFGRRVSILTPDGRFVRSISLTPPFEGGGSPTSFAALDDGSLLVGYSVVRTMLPQPTAAYFGQRVFHYGTNGQLANTAGFPLPESEHFVQQTPPAMGGVAYWNLAFGRVLSLRDDGEALLTGDGSDWSVERRTVEGRAFEAHRLGLPLSPVTAADRAAFRAREVTAKTPQQRAIEERMVAEMPYPKTKPAYRRLEPGPAGQIWIEAYEREQDGATRWIRLDSATRSAADLRLPPRFQAMLFTQDAVYGVWRDSDDAEHVRAYAFVR